MRNRLWLFSAFFLWAFALVQPSTTYYRSPSLRAPALNPAGGGDEHTIQDDHGQPMSVVSLVDADGIPYWYYRIFTPVCLTGECRPVDIGIYWHFSGKYLGIDVYREPLTKTDHSEFTPMDYDRLESILRNERSDLREYTPEELVEPVEKPSTGTAMDGITGATRKAVSEAAVKDAVFTTHTIWHLIHVGEPEQLALLALSEMSHNPDLIHRLLASADTENRDFVLRGVIDGHLQADSAIENTILQGLDAADHAFRSLSFNALSRLDLSAETLQETLATSYPRLKTDEKIKLLSALDHTPLNTALRTAFINEFTSDTQPWLLIKILSLFKQPEVPLNDREKRAITKLKTDHVALKRALAEMSK